MNVKQSELIKLGKMLKAYGSISEHAADMVNTGCRTAGCAGDCQGRCNGMCYDSCHNSR